MRNEERINKYKKCLNLAEFLVPFYIESGGSVTDIEKVFEALNKPGIGLVKSPLDEIIINDAIINMAISQKDSFVLKTGSEGYLLRANYYSWQGKYYLCCAYNYLVFVALDSAVQSSGKALGFLTVSKYLRHNEIIENEDDRDMNEFCAFGLASEIEDDFLNDCKKKGWI